MRMTYKVLLLILLFVILNFQPTCRDPNEFKPPEDTLLTPPPPPKLLTPPDGYVHITRGDNRLLVSWDSMPDADIYEIHFAGETLGEWTYRLSKCSINQNWFTVWDKFTWKVRAYGPKWQYYTDWSETWHFETRLLPYDPPQLLFPPNDTTFLVDTLPTQVLLAWSSVQGSQAYDLRVFTYSDTILWSSIDSTTVLIQINNADTYFWKVRARSSLWEFNFTGWSAINCFSVVKP